VYSFIFNIINYHQTIPFKRVVSGRPLSSGNTGNSQEKRLDN
jgi:hypothetical protein